MEQEEFKRRVLPLRERLIKYAVQLFHSREEAEDIIQEVYLKLWYMRNRLDKYESIPALAYQITKHLSFNRMKVIDRIGYLPETYDCADNNPEPHIHLEQKDQIEKIMLIIEQLPDLQKTILRMKHIEGFEVHEIAELTGSHPDAIRMNLSRARKKVKAHFNNHRK